MCDGLIGGNSLTIKEQASLKKKWKLLGSGLSTARMAMRFLGWLPQLKFFLEKIELVINGQFDAKKESILAYMVQGFSLLSGIFDNLVYLNRIKVRPYTTAWQKTWCDFLASFNCLGFLICVILEKLLSIYHSSKRLYIETLNKIDKNIVFESKS